MPARTGRHARSKEEDWGPRPPRSAEVAAAAAEQLAPARRPPARKDPGACKAAHWKGPHQPQIRVRQDGWRARPCRWDVAWTRDEPGWSCSHEEVCAGCGKVLRPRVSPEECPGYQPLTPQVRAWVDAEITRRRDQLAAARARHRLPPAGRQGYRRRRDAGG